MNKTKGIESTLSSYSPALAQLRRRINDRESTLRDQAELYTRAWTSQSLFKQRQRINSAIKSTIGRTGPRESYMDTKRWQHLSNNFMLYIINYTRSVRLQDLDSEEVSKSISCLCNATHAAADVFRTYVRSFPWDERQVSIPDTFF